MFPVSFAPFRRVPLAFLAAALGLLVGLGTARPAAAHAELERADPPQDGLLAAPPERVDLWLSEPVDQGAGSPSVRLFDEAERELPVGAVTLDPADPRHVVAEVDGLGSGTFTVGWSVRSATDGHTLVGTYDFRVGAARAAGSTTEAGERPEPWAVATRWLTFLGAALAAGGFAFARLIDGTRGRRPHLVAATAGAGAALLATLAEPVLRNLAPPAGTAAPGLAEAIRTAPDGWWLRLVALALLLLLALALWGRRPAPAVEWVGLGLGLAALLGLSLSSHAAAREEWRPLALPSNILHQWSIALWVGGLAHLALSWRALHPHPRADGEGTGGNEAVRRFSRMALWLVVVGVGTGVLNTGLVLPRVQALWTSDYGRVLLLKLLALAPVLALATFHRAALRRAVARVGGALLAVRTVRIEGALALLVVLGGSVMASMATPGARAGAGGGAGSLQLAWVDLAASLPVVGVDGGTIHLQLHPARPGENELIVLLSDPAGEPLPQPASVEVAFTPLDHEAPTPTVEAQPTAPGRYAAAGIDLPGEGWWRAEVTVAPPGAPEARVPFYLVLPDPNVAGEGPTPEGTAEAQEVFARGLAGMTSVHQVRFDQRLGDGSGTLYESTLVISDGSDGRPPAYEERSRSFETVIVGDRQWLRRAGQPWTERPASPLSLPIAWGEAYEDATGFRLGPVETVDGERSRVVTFYVPSRTEPRRREATWFAWWVGTESGRVRREAMISTRHYMLYNFGGFDAPLAIAPPADAAPATPAASPAATPGTPVITQ